MTAAALAGDTATNFPSAETLLNAQHDDANWVLPAKTYAGNRYTALTQIDKTNAGALHMAWKTSIADNGEQEAAPIVWNGIMYLSTPHDGVLALNASTGKLLWQTPYNPAYVLLFAVNRGVGLADGKLFIATQDCRVIALDATTGRSLWNVQGCLDTSNSWYSMAAYVYKNKIILGTGGSDNGNIGLVSAFSIDDGKRLWDWQTIPAPGEPGHETWPAGDSWKHGGGAVWSGVAIDQNTDTLFVAPGNPGPDFVEKVRPGTNLYTNSLVALDISGTKPRIKWYYKILENDTDDSDPAMIPVLFDGQVDGQTRPLVAVGDKAGNFVLLDRNTGNVVHRLAVSTQFDLNIQQTREGTKACPNHGGGIEWNGAHMTRTATPFWCRAHKNAASGRSPQMIRNTSRDSFIRAARFRHVKMDGGADFHRCQYGKTALAPSAALPGTGWRPDHRHGPRFHQRRRWQYLRVRCCIRTTILDGF